MSVSAVRFALLKQSQSSRKHFGKAASTPCRADSLRRQPKNPGSARDLQGGIEEWSKSLSPSYGRNPNSRAWKGREGAGIAAPRGCGETPAAHQQLNPALFRETAKIPFSLQYKPQNICERVKPPQFSVSLNPELAKYVIMEF